MKTTNGKLRNITSGVLHTEIGDVYEFFNKYTGHDGIMTHHIPSAYKAMNPILKRKLPEEWFTKEWIKDHEWLQKEVEVVDLAEDEKQEFWKSFDGYSTEMWGKIENKIIAIKTD